MPRGRRKGVPNKPRGLDDLSALNNRKLRDVIVAECNQFYKYGRRARASDVASIIRSDHPDLYAEYAGVLADRELRKMCADAMKSWQAVAGLDKAKGAEQLPLPGIERHMAARLPPALSLPVEGDKNDIMFVPSAIATKLEWTVHLQYLKEHHAAVGLVIAAISELLARGEGCPEGASLVDFVSHLSVAAA